MFPDEIKVTADGLVRIQLSESDSESEVTAIRASLTTKQALNLISQLVAAVDAHVSPEKTLNSPFEIAQPSIYMTSGHTQYIGLHDWTLKELTDLRRVVQKRIDVLASREAKGCTHPESESCV